MTHKIATNPNTSNADPHDDGSFHFEPVRLEAAYQKVRSRFETPAFVPKPLPRLDLMRVVTRALGVAREIDALGLRVPEEMPEVDPLCFTELADRALAAAYAHAEHLVRPRTKFLALLKEAKRTRTVLRASAKALEESGFLAQEVPPVTGTNGYRNVATDLQVLVRLFEAHFPDLSGKWVTTAADLEAAKLLVARLMDAESFRRQPSTSPVTADIRRRAFAYLIHSYDDVQRAVGFVRRREGDADRIAPSLYERGARKKEKEAKPAVESPPGATAPGTTSPVAAE